MSVANLTRSDSAGVSRHCSEGECEVRGNRYSLARANEALSDLRDGRVLRVPRSLCPSAVSQRLNRYADMCSEQPE